MRQRLESGCFGCQPTGAQGARAGDWEPKRPTVSQQLVREWKPKVRDGLNETNETTRSCEVGLLRCRKTSEDFMVYINVYNGLQFCCPKGFNPIIQLPSSV